MRAKTFSVQDAAHETIRVCPYDPAWPRRFDAEAALLRRTLPASLIGRIEHFGSTAVPGLAAKPIIDMLVEVPSLAAVQSTIAPILTALGYEYLWRPSWQNPDRAAYTWFIKRDHHGERTHHIHMLEPRSPEWERLRFRDYLIQHPATAKEYAALKYALAGTFADDRAAYARAKGDFIEKVSRAARQAEG